MMEFFSQQDVGGGGPDMSCPKYALGVSDDTK